MLRIVWLSGSKCWALVCNNEIIYKVGWEELGKDAGIWPSTPV